MNNSRVILLSDIRSLTKQIDDGNLKDALTREKKNMAGYQPYFSIVLSHWASLYFEIKSFLSSKNQYFTSS